MESTDGIQIFDDAEEDAGHKSDWHMNIKVMTPVSLLFMFFSYLDCDSMTDFVYATLIWFTWGLIVMWTLMEYIQHRFLLHQEVHLDPEAPWTKE